MEIITIVYLSFILVSLYLSFIFLILFFQRKKDLFRDPIPKKELPKISTLTAAYNEQDTIIGTIKNILSNNYPKNKLEIIVVDDGSTDKTLERVKKLKKELGIRTLKIISKKNSGKADSLNQAAKVAKGKILAVIDADSYIDKNAFQKMAPYFEDPTVAAVTASVLVKNRAKILEQLQAIEYTLIAWGRKLLQFLSSVYVTPGALSMYRKTTFLAVGGFDRNNITEDIELAWRLLRQGYKIKMCLSALSFTVVPNTFKKWWKQRIRWDIGGLQTAYKHRDLILKKIYGMMGMFVAPFFIGSLILSILGLSLIVYLFSMKILSIYFLTKHSIITSNNPFNINKLYILPNSFTFFAIVFIIITIIILYNALKTMKIHTKIPVISLSFLIYLFIYVTLFPILLIHSIYKIIIKDIKW